IVIFFFVVFFIMLSMLFTIKILAYKTAAPSGKIWNYSHSCYFVSYSPNYKPFGIAGRFLRFFSNQSFFIVYSKDGDKLKSSAWYFWEYQFSDMVSPKWSGIDFIYPTDQGVSGWTLYECGDKR
ncbi:hypothetical protein ACM36D_002539, partial [Cronobacter sakazakii]